MSFSSRISLIALSFAQLSFAACGGSAVDTRQTKPPAPKADNNATVTVTSQHFESFEEFAVAADEPQASAAGAEVLARGGNAADAAAATMLALGVTSFASSGLGGGGFALYYRAKDQSVTFLDFRETAPQAASADMYKGLEGSEDKILGKPSQYGGLAVGVPGEAAGIEELLRRFGSLPRKVVVAPALRLASKGFRVSKPVERFSEMFARDLLRDPGSASLIDEKNKRIVAGSILRRPELAQTLDSFARGGSKPFYRGEIAQAIVEAVQKHQGVITAADLAAYKVKEREPLSMEAFGLRWITAPAPSAGGYTLISSLHLLQEWLPKGRAPERSLLIHAFAESFKGAFADRVRYFGDPDVVQVPIRDLLNPERQNARARVFNPDLAIPQSQYALPLQDVDPQTSATPDGGGTSHLCVVDREGNVASVTTTINLPFGARITAAGMFLNDEMDDFASDEDVPNAFELPGGIPNLPGPHKRPVSSMTPTIVLKDNKPVLCVGASGGSRIVTAVTQAAYYAVVEDYAPADAVKLARIHHQGSPDSLRHEELNGEVLAQLAQRQHHLEKLEHGAVVQMIRIRDEAPRLQSASDPRKGGAPAGR